MRPPFSLAVLSTKSGKFKVCVQGWTDQAPPRLRYTTVEGQGVGFPSLEEARKAMASLQASQGLLDAAFEAAKDTGGTRDDHGRRVWPPLSDQERAALAVPKAQGDPLAPYRTPEHLAVIREKAIIARQAQAAERAVDIDALDRALKAQELRFQERLAKAAPCKRCGVRVLPGKKYPHECLRYPPEVMLRVYGKGWEEKFEPVAATAARRRSL